MNELKENRGNCEIEWREVKTSDSDYVVFIDLIIDGSIHRLNEHDLLLLNSISETGFNTLIHTPNHIRQNKTVKELGATTINSIAK